MQNDVRGIDVAESVGRAKLAAAGRDIAARDRRDRQSGGNGELQPAIGVAGIGDAVSQAALLERLDGEVAAPAIAIVERDRHRALLMHVMEVRRHPYCRVVHQHLSPRKAFPFEHDGEIEFTRGQRPHLRARMGITNGNLDLWVALGECSQRARQDRVSIFGRYADADRSAERRRDHRCRRLVEQRDDAPGVGYEFAAAARQRHAARAALEQAVTDHAFELLHLHRDRRLGTACLLCRLGEIAGVGHRNEGPQEIAVEGGLHAIHHKKI